MLDSSMALNGGDKVENVGNGSRLLGTYCPGVDYSFVQLSRCRYH